MMKKEEKLAYDIRKSMFESIYNSFILLSSIMKKILTLGLLGIGALLLAGCSQQSTDTSTEKEQVKIGVIAPLSWPAATYGEDAVNAYRSVIADNLDNEQFDFQLVIEDGKCAGRDAVTAVQKLINVDNVQVVLGWTCSSETLAAGEIAQSQGIVMLSPTSSAPEISNIGDFVFRYWNDLDAAQVLVDHLDTNNIDTIALVYENVDYPVAYANTVKDLFDGNIVLEEKFNTDEKDMSIIASRIAAASNEIDQIIFLPQGDTSAIAFVRALNNAEIWTEFASKTIGAEAVMSDTFMNELWALTNGIKVVQFPPFEELDNKAVSFMDDYSNSYEVKSNPVFVILDAESLQLTIDAITMVGNDANAIREYIAAYDSENPRNGLFGDYYFDRDWDGQGLRFVVQQMQDWELIPVE